MAAKKRQPLTREGEPTQRTPTGLEIPIPSRDELFEGLNRAARAGDRPERERGSNESGAPSRSE
jgi:hypothetical protein